MSSQIVNANPTVISHADLPSRQTGLSGSGLGISALVSNPLARYLGGIMWDLETSSAGICSGPVSSANFTSISGFCDADLVHQQLARHHRQLRTNELRDPFTLFSAAKFESLVAEREEGGQLGSDRVLDIGSKDGRSDSSNSNSRSSSDGDESSSSMTSVGTGVEDIDEQEIYDLIAPISDPEHPLSLGSLAVVNLEDIHIFHPHSPTTPSCSSSSQSKPSLQGSPSHARSRISSVLVEITPTITHCSLATVIGLGVRVRLEQALPPRFRIDVHVKPGTHSTAEAVTKQLTDKERVAAALENETLMRVIRKMLSTCK